MSPKGRGLGNLQTFYPYNFSTSGTSKLFSNQWVDNSPGYFNSATAQPQVLWGTRQWMEPGSLLPRSWQPSMCEVCDVISFRLSYSLLQPQISHLIGQGFSLLVTSLGAQATSADPQKRCPGVKGREYLQGNQLVTLLPRPNWAQICPAQDHTGLWNLGFWHHGVYAPS